MSVDLDKKAEPDLDAVISDVGEFGQRQIVHFILLCVPIALSTTLLLNFLFTSATLDYRCDKRRGLKQFKIKNIAPSVKIYIYLYNWCKRGQWCVCELRCRQCTYIVAHSESPSTHTIGTSSKYNSIVAIRSQLALAGNTNAFNWLCFNKFGQSISAIGADRSPGND